MMTKRHNLNNLNDMLRTGAFVALLLLMLVLATTVGNNASSVLSQETLDEEPYAGLCYSACTFSQSRLVEIDSAN